MTQPELVDTDWTLFRADGEWHPIGHGIEVMAFMHMRVGTFYIRAADTVKPLPRGSGQGPRSLTLSPPVPEDKPEHRQRHDQ